MGETIAIMFIFFLLLIVGLVFYVRISTTTTIREGGEQFERRAIEITQVISFLPEIQCTESNVVEPGCFDLFKLRGMANLVNTPGFYSFYARDFGKATIKIFEIYPNQDNFTVYDNNDGNYSEASDTNVPISIYDAESDTYEFGVMRITVYR